MPSANNLRCSEQGPLRHNTRVLRCLIEGHGKSNVFEVSLGAEQKIYGLRQLIYEKAIHKSKPFVENDLSLFKIILPCTHDSLRSLRSTGIQGGFEEMDAARRVSDFWLTAPDPHAINVLVKLPSSSFSPSLDFFDEDENLYEGVEDDELGPEGFDPKPGPMPRHRRNFLMDSDTVYLNNLDFTSGSPEASSLPFRKMPPEYLVVVPGLIAVDKTSYIEKLDEKENYAYLFLRPQGFGKSMVAEMLGRYYDTRSKQYFKAMFRDLYINRSPTRAACSLLVLSFDFKPSRAYSTFEEVQTDFRYNVNFVLSRFLNHHLLLPHDEQELLDKDDIASSLRKVFDLVKASGQKLFVGVENYDAPAHKAIFSFDYDLYRRINDLLNSTFFAVVKDAVAQDIVLKYWVSGVLPAFRGGVNDPLDTIQDISADPNFHGLCGLTNSEVQTITEFYLSSTPRKDVDLTASQLQQCPQQAFAYLDGFAEGKSIELRDRTVEAQATSIMNAIPNDGASQLLAPSLKSEIKSQFSPQDIRDASSTPSLMQTLLYFLGVLTYTESGPSLRIPDKAMYEYISTRFGKSESATSKSGDS